MAMFPERSGKSLEKLFNKDWSRFFYNDPVETWDEKCRSMILEWWRQLSIFFESRARQFNDYWYLCAMFFAGTILLLTIHKSLRYLATIEFREKDNPEIRIEVQTCAAVQEARIVSNNDNDRDDDEEEQRDESLVESRPTFPTIHPDAITASDNDQSSSISSKATIVPADLPNARTDFLEAFIDSIEPGGDDQTDRTTFSNSEDIDDPESLDQKVTSPKEHYFPKVKKQSVKISKFFTARQQHESTLRKVDSENFKRFYVLTPWIEPLEKPSSSEESVVSARKSTVVAEPDWGMEDKSLTIGNDEPATTTSRNPSNLAVENNKEEPLAKIIDPSVDREESNLERNDISTLEEFGDKSLLQPSSIEEPAELGLPLPEVHREKSPCVSLPGSDASSAESTDSHRELVQEIPEESVDFGGPEIRTDSRQRFRSLSHDDRSASNAALDLETRRGGSVSPPSGKKNQQRTPKQAQSKIPAPSTPTMNVADRALRHCREIDGSSISEAAEEIRTALLRKFRDVCRHQPESPEHLPTTSCSTNSENIHVSSIDSPTPEGVSRIPLPRKSPRTRTSQ